MRNVESCEEAMMRREMGFGRDNNNGGESIAISTSSRYNVTRRESTPLNPERRICDTDVTDQQIEGELEINGD